MTLHPVLASLQRQCQALWQAFLVRFDVEARLERCKDKSKRFYRLFASLILRDIAKNKLRTALTVLGIALGVSIILAINLANKTAVSHFRDSLDRISGKANIAITASGAGSGSGWLKETVLTDLQWLRQQGVKMTPVIEQSAVFNSSDKPFVVSVLGVDMLADSAFRSYDWAFESNPLKRPDQFFDIFENDGAFIGSRLAQANQLSLGDSFTLLINDQQKTFRVTGILSDKGLGGAYGGDLILMDIATAQETFGLSADDQHGVGRLTRIDAIVPTPEDHSDDNLIQIMSELEGRLPSGTEVSRTERRGAQVDKMLRAYQYNLTVLSFIALLVGLFLIYNTMSITVIRRRTDIGTLRALGVSRKTVMMLFGMEALGLGLCGSLLGIILGLCFEVGAIQAVSQTVESLYVGIGVKGMSLAPSELFKALLLGLGITAIGAFIPVWEASSIQPAEATRRASYDSKIQRVSKPLAWLGGVLAIVALIASWQPAINGLPLYGFFSALCLVLSAAFLTPITLHWLLPKLEPLAFKYGRQEAKLALKHLHGSLGRTSVAVASLMVGIAMMVSLAIMIGSFRETVNTWVNQTLKADLWIEPVAKGSGKLPMTISPKVVDTIRFTDGVEAVDAFYEFPIFFKNSKGHTEPARVGVGQWHVAKKYGGQLKFIDGKSTEEVLGRILENLMADPSVLVTESFANRNNIRQNQMIRLDTPSGPMDVRVVDIYMDYSSDLGYIVMPRELYNLYYDDDSVSGLAVYLDKRVSPSYVKNIIQRKFGSEYQLRIRTNKELRQEVLRIFDNTFAITYALHVIAIIVALLGVMNSLLAMVLASRRDFGILKYMGSSRKQIRKIILTQAGIFGLLGNVMGLLVGVLLSLLLVFVINKQSFGWTIQWSPPFLFLVESFVLVMVTAILSGLFPAKVAADTLAPEVLHAE